ncbi:hypothetical protein BRYFOR_05747 [Marvinbryantia formatexigens DSM 14469]|uniref:Uncharacterized protein n=1 Tax=Marvinbryantia formatexigens DSM 14469 TaxID=478749 RepID=C6LAV3_9FIRM|nr:hypothetical protein BRYFOR_05747 [Marvinbryantia formatexigens DSM 14469]
MKRIRFLEIDRNAMNCRRKRMREGISGLVDFVITGSLNHIRRWYIIFIRLCCRAADAVSGAGA